MGLAPMPVRMLMVVMMLMRVSLAGQMDIELRRRNPATVDALHHGGIAQAIGAVFYEESTRLRLNSYPSTPSFSNALRSNSKSSPLSSIAPTSMSPLAPAKQSR